MHKTFATLGFLTGLFGTQGSVFAQPPCQPFSDSDHTRDKAVEALKRYSEAPAFMGLSKRGHMIEVFTTEDGSTWTLVLTQPNGKQSCLIDAGDAWTPVEPQGPQL